MKKVFSLIISFVLLINLGGGLGHAFDGGLTEKETHFETMQSEPTPDELAVESDYEWLVGESVIHYGRFYNDITFDITLPTVGENGSIISWESSEEGIIDTSGHVTQPLFSYAMGNAPVTLTATITSGTVSKQKTIYLEVVPLAPTDVDYVAMDKELLTYELILNGNISADNVKTRLNLQTKAQSRWIQTVWFEGCDIAWESSNPNVIALDGRVNRPTKEQGDQNVTLTATISTGEESDTKDFQFTVTIVEEFPLAIKYDDFSDRTDLLQFNGTSEIVATTDRGGNNIQALKFQNGGEAGGGSVFAKNKIRLGEDLSFSTAFSFSNPHTDYIKGTEGFIFTIQTVNSEVYAKSLNDESIKPSFGIAFTTNYRTYPIGSQGTGYIYDIYSGLYNNGNYDSSTEEYLGGKDTNEPPAYYNAWIEYDGTAKVLEVWCAPSEERPAFNYMHLRQEDIDLGQILTSAEIGLETEDVREIYAGFMSSLGNVNESIEIESWYFKNDPIPIDFSPYIFKDLSHVTLAADSLSGQANSTLTATVSGGNGPVAGTPIEFSTSFGTLNATTVITDEFGKACVKLSSSESGHAVVKAVVEGGAMDSVEVSLTVNDDDRLTFDYAWLTEEEILNENSTLNNITSNLSLPESGLNGSVISWVSSNTEIIANNGIVTRPSIVQGPQQVTLTATLSIGELSQQKNFNVTVKVRDDDLVSADWDWLTEERILGDNNSIDSITESINLPLLGTNGSVISWASDEIGIVAQNGTVNRPSYTVGNKTVTITATISTASSSMTKTFILTVIALEATDSEAVYEDYDWLTTEIVLNGNESINDIVSDLNLPVIAPKNSAISWATSDTNWISIEGKVTRPSYVQGNKAVTLIATVSRGSVLITKAFNFLVIEFLTDAEIVSLDKEWLTWQRIRGENYAINTVSKDLNLVTTGYEGSSIRWESDNEVFVKPDGTINRPTFIQGNKWVNLTATISKGSETTQVTFNLTLPPMEQTDEEAVTMAKSRLSIYETLGDNPSPFSITENLSLPDLLSYNTSATWVSGMPEVISNGGTVIRPEYVQGHKTVDIIVTIKKGNAVDSRTLTYTVLSKPDTFAPKVISTTPAQEETDVLVNTQSIIITFDENIKAGTETGSANSLGIELLSSENTKISVQIDNKKLIVTPYTDIASGINRLKIPSGAITDMSGNAFGGFELTFTVEERQSRRIEVISSTPDDREKDISSAPEISFSFNFADIIEGAEFLKKIQLRTSGGISVPVIPSLNGDVVTLILGEEIMPGQVRETELLGGVVYELVISAGAVHDRFMNENAAKTIIFKTFLPYSTPPAITSVYPAPGQDSVDIGQSITVNFSGWIDFANCGLILRDNLGNIVDTYKSRVAGDNNTVVLTPHMPLKPNTEYTLSAPYEPQYDPSELEFNMQFTTGANTLGIAEVSPKTFDVPVNSPVKIEFFSDITEGPSFDSIIFIDSSGNPVPFTAEISGTQTVLKPSSLLNPAKTYTVNTPAGAYQDGSGNQSDSYSFNFGTARKLSTDSCKIISLSEWFVEKSMLFKIDSNIEKVFRSANYQILSFEWDFGDGYTETGKKAVHSFSDPGEYRVVLTVTDDKGFSYEIEKTVTIRMPDNFSFSAVNPEYQSVSVTPTTTPELIYQFRIEHRGLFVHEEKIECKLVKDGSTERVYPEISADLPDSAYKFTFNPDINLFGTYELVFTYQGQSEKKEIRIPVTVFGTPSYVYPRIKLYDTTSGGLFEGAYINVVVDGVKTVAIREKDNKTNDYYYRIDKKFMLFENLPIEISGWEIRSTRIRVLDGSYEPQIIVGRPAQLGITQVTNNLTGANWMRIIEGVSTGRVTFSCVGEWNGLDKGYYELKTDTDSFNKTSLTGRFSFDPGEVLKHGEYLMVRMVSGEGIKSPWKYLPVYAVKPPVFMGSPLNISYVGGRAYLSTPGKLSEVTGSKIPLLDDVPLLSGGNFGIDGNTPAFSGYIDEYGQEAILNFEGGASYGSSTSKHIDTKYKKIKKAVSAGYEVGTEVEGELYYTYNSESAKWDFSYVAIEMDGYGWFSWTRGYMIPVIDVGIETELKMGCSMWGTLIIDKKNSNDQYRGIIRITPSVGVEVMFGADWVNVTGSVEGKIPAQVHYPTWYVGADVNITAKITGTFLLYSDTLYEKNLFSAHWDNGKNKVVLKSVPIEGEQKIENDGLQLMPRNYLNRESRWLSNTESSHKALFALNSDDTSKSNLQTALMMENIYPEAEIGLVQSGEELWLVWTDDNPQRSDTNRTQIRYSVMKDGSWQTPEWIGQDETADFAPAIAATQNGTLMAWQNIKQVVTEEDGLGGLIRNTEITVTGSTFSAEDSEPELVTLTDDDKFDHSPKLAADGDNALLVWTKSEGLGIAFSSEMEEYKSPANSDRLFFSVWDGTAWSEAAEIEDSLPTVLNSNLTMYGKEGLLLYNFDMDSDMSTQDDREIFARVFNGNLWEKSIPITKNQTNDASPKAVYINGNWFITWLCDGKIMFREGLDGKTKTDELLQSVQGDYKIIAGQGKNPQIAIVYKQLGENKDQTLSAYFYDIDSGIWGGELSLTQDEGFIGSFSPVFTQDGKLSVAYSNAEIITEVIDGIEQKNISDKVDLRIATYLPIRDLALDQEEGLYLSSEVPLPSTLTTIVATVINQGDFPENAIVELYDGNPSNGGEKIAEPVEQLVPAHSLADVEIKWLVGKQEKDEYELYTVVRSDDDIQDINTDNNTISINILTADIAITNVKCENVAGNDYIVTATIVNLGSKTIEGIEAQLTQPQGEEVLKTTEIENLSPGQEVIIDFILSSESLITDGNGRINMLLSALVPDSVQEKSKENNLYEFKLEAASILVEISNPCQGENLFDIKTPLTIGFNMAVEAREDFDKIILEDDELNEISIIKILEGNMLTVTPQSDLQHDTQYTLTIPERAFGDAYGHSMSEPYVLSFTTTSSIPQVVFSYPGNKMEDTNIDTDIRLQFNQTILEGPAFKDIVMYGNSEEITVSASLEAEWLTFTTNEPLNKSTTYSLVIPKGAVQNEEQEVQQEEYTLEFTTGETTGGETKKHSSSYNTAQRKHKISRKNLEDGSSMAIVEINEQSIIKTNDTDVTITLSDELKNDSIIQINISNNVLLKIANYLNGLNIITGKGDIRMPVDLVASFAKERSASVMIELTTSDKPTIQLTLTADGKQIAWDNPNLPFEISIPYMPGEDELSNTESIIIRYIDGEDNVVLILNGYYNSDTEGVIFTSTRFGNYIIDYNKVDFNDVEADAWYAKAVSYIAARGITLGTGDGKFDPEGKLTRGQLIVMLMRNYNILPDEKSEDNFNDSGNTYYTGYLAVAKRLGLSAGIGDNMFAPDREITRQEMFTLLYNVLKFIGKLPQEKSIKDIDDFSDAKQIDSWAKDSMRSLVEAGIIEGNDGRLLPMNLTTRAEMAQVLLRQGMRN